MGDVALMLADAPDAVTVHFGGTATAGLWLSRIHTEDAGGHLAVDVAGEHLVIESGSLPGLARKALLTFTEGADYGGATHTRRITTFHPKDDDRALTRVFVEKA